MARICLGLVWHNVDQQIDEFSTNPISSKAVFEAIANIAQPISVDQLTGVAKLERSLELSGGLIVRGGGIRPARTYKESPQYTQMTSRQGWYIHAVDCSKFNGGAGTVDVYIGSSQLTCEKAAINNVPDAYDINFDSELSGFVVGNYVSIINGRFANLTAPDCAVILAIDHNKITIGEFNPQYVATLFSEDGKLHTSYPGVSSYKNWTSRPGIESVGVIGEWSIALSRPKDGSVDGLDGLTIPGQRKLSENGFVWGNYSAALEEFATVIGNNSIAWSIGSIVLGQGLYNTCPNSVLVGRYNEITSNPFVFAVGCGSDKDHRKTAFSVDTEGNVKCGKIAELKKLGENANIAAIGSKLNALLEAFGATESDPAGSAKPSKIDPLPEDWNEETLVNKIDELISGFNALVDLI